MCARRLAGPRGDSFAAGINGSSCHLFGPVPGPFFSFRDRHACPAKVEPLLHSESKFNRIVVAALVGVIEAGLTGGLLSALADAEVGRAERRGDLVAIGAAAELVERR